MVDAIGLGQGFGMGPGFPTWLPTSARLLMKTLIKNGTVRLFLESLRDQESLKHALQNKGTTCSTFGGRGRGREEAGYGKFHGSVTVQVVG